MKSLEQLLGASAAKQLLAELRGTVEDLFEPPGRGSSLEQTRDNLWETYISGSVEQRSALGAARRAYNEIFAQVAEQRGFGKDSALRRRFMTQLSRTLQENVKGYKKIDVRQYVPTSADLAQIRSITLGLDSSIVDLANQLTGLEELHIHGHGEREPRLGHALAAALPATKLRELTIEGGKGDILEGAVTNPAWAGLASLALYECAIKPQHVGAALARWPALAALAIRTEGKLATAMLDVIAAGASHLVELALIDTKLADGPVEALLLARPWPRLKQLTLSGNNLSPAMITKLKKRPKLKVHT